MDPKRLREIPLFASLGKRELEQVGAWTDEVELPAGRVLGREGAMAYEFFVIEDGAAEITVDGKHLTDLGPGDFFGEIGLLERERRTATVTTTPG
jgi:CRP-like cAMP-binding protein